MSPPGRPRIPLGSRRKPVPREVLWLLGFVLGDLAANAINSGSFSANPNFALAERKCLGSRSLGSTAYIRPSAQLWA